MGYARYDNASYMSFAKDIKHTSRSALFSRTSSDSQTKSGQQLNADKIEYRESRDSEANPQSTPVLVGLDVTGSMGFIPERLVKGGLGTFINGILQRKPISDPHLLFMGIGDAVAGDRAPLQVTQFESDNRICDQLMDIYLEGGGGGNHFESYDLAWAFATHRTRTDAWDKRKTKGFLFTIGDEEFPASTSTSYLERVFKNDRPQDPSPISLLSSAQERYHVFHLIITEGSYAKRDLKKVVNSWQQHLQRRAIVIHNHELVPEYMISAIALENGVDLDEVLSWWESSTSNVLRETFS